MQNWLRLGRAEHEGDPFSGEGPPGSRSGTPAAPLDPLAVAVAAGAAALVAAGCWRYGPALYQLGIHSLTAARALLRGETMVASRGEVYAQWPPLHAFVLAAGEAIGAGWRVTGLATNALSAAVVVAVSARTLATLSGSRWLGLLLAAVVAASPRLYEGMITLGSEPIFMALASLALWHAVRFAGEPRALWFALAAVESALACLQRYVGVFLVAALAIVVFASAPRRRRLGSAAAFCAIALAPLALWIARNLWLTGTPTGERPANDYALGDSLANAWNVLRGWIAPPSGARGVDRALSVAFAACALAGLASALPLVPVRARRRGAVLAALFPVVFVGALLATSAFVWLDPVDDRLLLPALPGVLMVVLLGGRALADIARRARIAVASIALVALALATALGIRDERWLLHRALTDGPGGCGTREAMESELIAWLASHPLDGPVFGNLPERAAFARGRATRLLPTEGGRADFGAIDAASLPCHVVWVQRDGKPALRTKPFEDRLRFEVLADFPDGEVWRVERARP